METEEERENEVEAAAVESSFMDYCADLGLERLEDKRKERKQMAFE
jgi:hypothetical protein